MRTLAAIQIATLSLSTLLAGCMTEGLDGGLDGEDGTETETETETDSLDEDGAPETASLILCLNPPNPPPANATRDFEGSNLTIVRTVQNYGTTACSAYTSRWLGYGRMTASIAATASTPEVCVNTSMTVREYAFKWVWTAKPPVTLHGEWTATGCEMPSYKASVGGLGADEVRLHVKAQRVTCAGQLCGTQYGFPFRLTSSPY